MELTLVVLLIIYESYKMSHIPRVDYDALSIFRDALTFLGVPRGARLPSSGFSGVHTNYDPYAMSESLFEILPLQ